MEILGNSTLNPWTAIWTKPRDTIQQIVDTNPERFVLLLAAVAGFGEALNRASTKSLGDHLEWPLIVLLAAVVGPIFGIAGLYVGGALLRWTGGWLGGEASSRNIRAAMAWSSVPLIWALPLWIPELALFGNELFTSETPSLDGNPSLAYAMMGFGVIEIVIGIWAIVVFLKCLGQVQGFSAWKALGNSVLSGLVIVVPLLIIVFAVVAVTR